MSAQDIADKAGLSVTLIRRLLRTAEQGRPVSNIARTTADAVQGIPIPVRREPGSSPGLTNTTEAAALLADLARAGWPATILAARLGVSASAVAQVRDRCARLHVDLALRIRRVHRELISLDPVSQGVRAADAARTRAAAVRRAAGN
ncbi:hypothetical protein ACFYZ5_44455 [Streptomyces chartreusis]|uniref:hypothetical protein n=1 Tax=Streptomyces chartreusis TaxID=1969 RepID=UPI00368B0FB9